MGLVSSSLTKTPMEEEEIIGEEVVTPEVPEEEEEHVETEPEEQEETIEELRAKLADTEVAKAKADEIAENQRIRAEKAEKKAKESKNNDSLSSSDMLAILAAKVDEEDTDRVIKFAKDEGVSVREALKNPELKAILDVRAEQRDTAAAANTTNVRRGPSKTTDDVLVQNASKGKLPESDEEISRLMAAKMKKR